MDQREPLLEHLRELRSRLMKAAIALFIATVVASVFAKSIFQVLLAPAGGQQLVATELTEFLSTYVKVSLLGGLVLAMPVIVFQMVMFVRPALLPRERRYLYLALPAVSLSFLAGVLFGYYVLLPPAIGFLLTFGSDIVQPLPRIGNYISLVTTLLLWLGLAFELPFVLFLLARLGVVSPQALARGRRWAIVLAFVVGGVITPTFDPLNQSLVAVPIILLYELGTQLSKIAGRGRRRELERRGREGSA